MKNRFLKKFKAFIFDLDGTLLDSMQVWDKVYAAPFNEYGIDVPDDYIMKVNHLSLKDCVKYTLSNTPLPCDGEKLNDIWWKHAYKEYAENVPLKEGAYELLSTLSEKGISLAVATASPYSLFVPCLKRLGIYDLFDCFVSTDEVARGKDCPDVYLKAAARLNVSPEESAVVEDSHIGVKSAKAAGFYTIGVYDKASEKYSDVISSTADIYIRSLNELTERLK